VRTFLILACFLLSIICFRTRRSYLDDVNVYSRFFKFAVRRKWSFFILEIIIKFCACMCASKKYNGQIDEASRSQLNIYKIKYIITRIFIDKTWTNVYFRSLPFFSRNSKSTAYFNPHPEISNFVWIHSINTTWFFKMI